MLSTGVMIDDSAYETEAYCEALYKATLVSLGAFANSARRDLTIADLLNEPQRYRGQVMHFEGKVRRIRRLDPPAAPVSTPAMVSASSVSPHTHRAPRQ